MNQSQACARTQAGLGCGKVSKSLSSWLAEKATYKLLTNQIARPWRNSKQLTKAYRHSMKSSFWRNIQPFTETRRDRMYITCCLAFIVLVDSSAFFLILFISCSAFFSSFSRWVFASYNEEPELQTSSCSRCYILSTERVSKNLAHVNKTMCTNSSSLSLLFLTSSLRMWKNDL